MAFSKEAIEGFTNDAMAALVQFGNLVQAFAIDQNHDVDAETLNKQREVLVESFTRFLLAAPKPYVVLPGVIPNHHMSLSAARAHKKGKPGKAARHNKPPRKFLVAAKRPLNSYIAFRSFYQVIFVGIPQKEVSGLIRQLWQADLFNYAQSGLFLRKLQWNSKENSTMTVRATAASQTSI